MIMKHSKFSFTNSNILNHYKKFVKYSCKTVITSVLLHDLSKISGGVQKYGEKYLLCLFFYASVKRHTQK